ncbi:hypothetical protein AB205_0211750 [Aquarana catesbeiana]|uniref:Myb/SANT-like DNA-binding domain-containing protein n=1 Tax=Aquarana catesbeiana TaxID=8400 RepID=A0A2G9QIN7_AQUCT|nr:hypothetical protein AB205_0211750 [Aquarana catesbeiana]
MSRSRRRRFKASNMSFEEMVEMVDILKRADYDGKYGPYLNPNVRKAKIMTKVVKSLRRNFGVQRSKEQLRKRWSDQIKGAGSVQKDQESDVQVVVPKSSVFTSDSAQWMIQKIMFCSQDLDIIKEKTKEIEQRLKNMIHVLGKI